MSSMLEQIVVSNQTIVLHSVDFQNMTVTSVSNDPLVITYQPMEHVVSNCASILIIT